jgi:cyclopentanol dehydrogenase
MGWIECGARVLWCIWQGFSLDAYTGAPSSGAAYVSSKVAVQFLTKFAAIVLRPSNIRVNSIHPGATGTDLSKQVLSEDMLEGFLDDIPLGKLGEPVDVAYTTLFLASDLPSTFPALN